MEWGGPAFVIAIIAITTGGWVLNDPAERTAREIDALR